MILCCGTGLAVVDAEVNDVDVEVAGLWNWKGRLGGRTDCEAVGLNLLMRSWMPEFIENVLETSDGEVVMTGCCSDNLVRLSLFWKNIHPEFLNILCGN